MFYVSKTMYNMHFYMFLVNIFTSDLLPLSLCQLLGVPTLTSTAMVSHVRGGPKIVAWSAVLSLPDQLFNLCLISCFVLSWSAVLSLPDQLFYLCLISCFIFDWSAVLSLPDQLFYPCLISCFIDWSAVLSSINNSCKEYGSPCMCGINYMHNTFFCVYIYTSIF